MEGARAYEDKLIGNSTRNESRLSRLSRLSVSNRRGRRVRWDGLWWEYCLGSERLVNFPGDRMKLSYECNTVSRMTKESGRLIGRV
jgi:hypothetical protein